MSSTTIIGIAGGSGSGKTSVTNKIMKNLDGHSVALIEQDFYYKDQSHLTFEERLQTNYDHPFAFDNDLLIQNLKDLKAGKSVEVPTYDYTIHTRSDKKIAFEPKDVIIVEGIFALENETLRDMMDVKNLCRYRCRFTHSKTVNQRYKRKRPYNGICSRAIFKCCATNA